MKISKPVPFLVLGLLALPSTGCWNRSSSSQAFPDTGLQDPETSSEPLKADVLNLTRAHYLYQGHLPAEVNLQDHPTAHKLLDFLTSKARAENLDRNWSSLMPKALVMDFYTGGAVLGFGIRFALDGGDQAPRVRIAAVEPGSPAQAAGLVRGAHVLGIAASQGELGWPSANPVDPANTQALTRLLAFPQRGATAWFRVVLPGDATRRDLPLQASAFRTDPVPGAHAPRILDAGQGRKVGYLAFNDFITPAVQGLRSAFAAFKTAGVTDLVLDLRYNGGGDLNVVPVLANLLHPQGGPGEVMYRQAWNPKNADLDHAVTFSPEPHAFRPRKLAVITTAQTASASEAVINLLQPIYRQDLAVVGGRTHGKPVGGNLFLTNSNDWLLSLITFRVLNGQGEGNYYRGLPDAAFRGVGIAAKDDLDHPLGDQTEASLAAALGWILRGETGTPMPGPGQADHRMERKVANQALPSQDIHPGLY